LLTEAVNRQPNSHNDQIATEIWEGALALVGVRLFVLLYAT